MRVEMAGLFRAIVGCHPRPCELSVRRDFRYSKALPPCRVTVRRGSTVMALSLPNEVGSSPRQPLVPIMPVDLGVTIGPVDLGVTFMTVDLGVTVYLRITIAPVDLGVPIVPVGFD